MSDSTPPPWRRAVAATLPEGRFALAFPLAAAVALLAFGVLADDPYWIRELSLIAVLALVVSGLNLSFGYAGAFQFGQVFAFGFGCYVTMILSIAGFDEVLALVLVGGLTAAAAGALIALPALRIGGWPLAIASLFLVVLTPDLVGIFPGLTGGLNGLIDIPVPKLFGRPLDSTGLYEVTMVVAIAWFALYRNLVTSRYGVMLRTLRESPVLTSSLGLSSMRLRVTAFAVGAFPAGMAGCLFGFISLVVTPSQFGLTLAIGLVAASILGGIESVYGAVLGAAILQLGPETSLTFDAYAPIAYGVFLIVAAVAFRSGLSGLGNALARQFRHRLVERATVEPHGRERPAIEFEPVPGVPLTVSSVSKAFAGNRALKDVSFSARPGEVTAVIGANGSGKTTLLNVISRYSAVQGPGRLTLGAIDITRLAPHAVARAGVARTFQASTLPRGLCTLDAVASGRFARDYRGVVSCMLRLPSYRRAQRADRREALALLDLLGLRHVAHEPAGQLSQGTRRLIEVARALAARPRLLLLDEPAAGLSADEIQRLAEVVTAVARSGMTVVVIEHNLVFVREVADVTHVLQLGTLVASGPTGRVLEAPAVAEGLLGPALPAPAMRGSSGADRTLEVRGIVAGFGALEVLSGVTLHAQSGTVELVLGRNGAGKSTLLATIAGQIPLRAGTIAVDGAEVGSLPAHRRAAAGIAFVPEGKRIFRERTVAENIAVGTFPRSLSRRERARVCEEVLEHFPMLQARTAERAGDLSGGQQQMLALGQALAAGPRLLLLDEPSAGLAPAVVGEIFATLRRLTDDGLTVVVVEQRVPEALAIADHVTILDGGTVVSAGAPQAFSDRQDVHQVSLGAAPS